MTGFVTLCGCADGLRRRGTLALAVAAATLPLGRQALAQDADVSPHELHPGVLVHTALGLAYVTSTQGGIEAFRLSNGSWVWSNHRAAKPIAVTNNRLIAQGQPAADANLLEIVTLYPDSGVVLRTDTATLPEGIPALIEETPIGVFETLAYRQLSDMMVVWEFTPRSHRGIAPGADPPVVPGGPPAPRAALGDDQVTRGTVRVNLANGVVSPFPGVEAAPLPPRVVSPAGSNHLLPSDTGRYFFSSDRRHLMVSQRVADDRSWDKYRWIVYEVAEPLARVGETRSHVSFSPFVVYKEMVVYVTEPYERQGSPPEPAKLRAFSLISGTEAWSVPFRDTEYRGPRPP